MARALARAAAKRWASTLSAPTKDATERYSGKRGIFWALGRSSPVSA